MRGMFLSAFDLQKAVYIATSGAIALVVDSTRIATYFTGGTRLEPLMMFGLLIYVPASLVGSVIGKRVVERVPQDQFRIFVAAFIFLAGLDLAIFP